MIAPSLDAAKFGSRNSTRPEISDVEIDYANGTLLITGAHFAGEDGTWIDFRRAVQLSLAEGGIINLRVEERIDLSTVDPNKFTSGVDYQLLVSGLPENIEEFAGDHILHL